MNKSQLIDSSSLPASSYSSGDSSLGDQRPAILLNPSQQLHSFLEDLNWPLWRIEELIQYTRALIHICHATHCPPFRHCLLKMTYKQQGAMGLLVLTGDLHTGDKIIETKSESSLFFQKGKTGSLSDDEIKKAMTWLREKPIENCDRSRVVKIIKETCPRVKKQTTEEAKEGCESIGIYGALVVALAKLAYVEKITAPFATATEFKKCLSTIKDIKYGFSVKARVAAEELHKGFDAQDYGDYVAKDLPNTKKRKADAAGETQDTTMVENNSPLKGEKPRKRATTRSTAQQSSNAEVIYPDPDHPYFGTGMIMDRILIRHNKSNGKSSRYLRDPPGARPDCNIIGNNGLLIGTWWPFQLCLVRDGAHGSSQGGIGGNAETGACSITSTASYGETDHDIGDTLWYSAPKSDENEDGEKVVVNNGAKALETSFKTRQEIRVIRGAGAGASAPSVGFRYDGLYKIVGRELGTNSLHGAYYKYKMERIPGQEPLKDVVQRSPTVAEKRAFVEIKKGY